MRSVMIRISAAEFSGTMRAIAEWLDVNGYEPTRYKYNHSEDAVFVTIDFPAAVVADAFAICFGSVYQLFLQPASPDGRQLTTSVCHRR